MSAAGEKKSREVRSSSAYEQFVRDVQQALLQQTQIKNIDVRHNVRLQGKSGARHQVDVFWEFELAGTVFKTCIECKQFSSAVKKLHVASFIAVLDDIGGATGIFVTTRSYQLGAKKFAAQKNIRLLVLNPVLRSVALQMELEIPSFSVRLACDDEAVKAAQQKTGLSRINCDPHMMLLNADGSTAEPLKDLLNRTVTINGSHIVPLAGYYFQSDAGLLPLREALCSRTSTVHREEMLIDVSDTVTAILDDVLQNTSSYVHDDGTTEPVPVEVVAAGGGRLIPTATGADEGE